LTDLSTAIDSLPPAGPLSAAGYAPLASPCGSTRGQVSGTTGWAPLGTAGWVSGTAGWGHHRPGSRVSGTTVSGVTNPGCERHARGQALHARPGSRPRPLHRLRS